MPKIIRIGTRDSELALWQAKTVQRQLEHLGHKTQLVPVKSEGDIVLNKPIYELGTTGVFTKVLDSALLNNSIDIAVHSLKDVPTALPKGIVQAAVLKRGNVKDVLVYKNNEEFLSQKDAIIATGSLRRKAQWLNRYPTHHLVGLRGNVNTRLQKLKDNDWNGAIFAAAGLGRIGLTPDETIPLDWMVPAPAQGAVMITALSEDNETRAICAEINHEETEICSARPRQHTPGNREVRPRVIGASRRQGRWSAHRAAAGCRRNAVAWQGGHDCAPRRRATRLFFAVPTREN
jgi:hydroxymethylbilane synthase